MNILPINQRLDFPTGILKHHHPHCKSINQSNINAFLLNFHEEHPASIFKHVDTEDTVDPHTSQELSDKEPIVHCPTTV